MLKAFPGDSAVNIRLFSFVLPLLLCACVSGRASLPPENSLPAWGGPTISARFSARVKPQAQDLPLQGGIQLDAQGGRLGLITQNGRTVGYCVFSPVPPNTAGMAGMVWTCEAAPGMEAAAPLLARVAGAVYQGLDKALEAEKTGSAPLRHIPHKDTLGEVDILFMEIKKP